MGLEIKNAHLQYMFSLLALPSKYPQFMYANADIFYHFFRRMDEKTTNYAKKETKSGRVKSSWLGEFIIELSEQDFQEAKSGATPSGKESMKKFSRNSFLNLAAWYVLPLFEANGRRCPYVTQEWIHNFLRQKKSLGPENLKKYYRGIYDFLGGVQNKWWLRPLQDIAKADHLGNDADIQILIIVGMFIEAQREQEKRGRALRRKGLKKQTAINLAPEIIEFINNIKEIDEVPPPD